MGMAAAISGDTVIVGAPSYDVPGADAGAAFVFTRTGTTNVPLSSFLVSVCSPDAASVYISSESWLRW